MRNVDLTSADVAKLGGTAKLMEREWAPCRNACPVHADVRSYLQALAEGRWRDAIDVIRENLPFASACGRVCHHPCEANCRRRDVDAAVAIRELKRFVAEMQGAKGATVRKAARQDKARVAIVGGGPSGLSAALNLAKMGYRPTVFEKFPVAGGIPRTAIPAYRMPREVVQMDVDWICAHGIELVTGVEIGKAKSLDDLKREGFEAVVLATGLSSSRMLPLPGADNPRVFGALGFLTDAAFGRPVDLGSDVLVIGGGNVAVDAARTALRLGPTRVRMMCLENAEEMPAFEWERRETAEEGIEVFNRRGPTEVIIRGGRIVGVKTRAVTRVFDENKRFSPQYNDLDVTTLECDTVIMAIGQAQDYGFLAGAPIKLDERKRLPVSPATHQANVPWIFAAGEIVTPPGSVVEACASGRRCAAAVDMFLRGAPISIDDALPPYIDKIPAETAEKVLKVEREPVAFEPAATRKQSFAQVDHAYSMESVLREARRCMSCGAGAEVLVDKCAACLTCLRVCPFGIPKVTDVARIDSTLCQSCGICIAECPSNAIVAKGWEARAPLAAVYAAYVASRSQSGPSGVSSSVVAFVSGFRATAEEWNHQVPPIPGVAEVYLTTVARLSVRDLLEAFERGASKVLVVACRDGQDRYPEATKRAKRRVEQASALLAEIGIKDAIKLLDVADAGREAVRAAIEAALL